MDLTSVVAILTWGSFAALVVLTLKRVRAVMRGERGQLGSILAWTSALAFAAFWMSVGTAFLLGFGAFATCGPLWVSNLYWRAAAGASNAVRRASAGGRATPWGTLLPWPPSLQERGTESFAVAAPGSAPRSSPRAPQVVKSPGPPGAPFRAPAGPFPFET